MNNRDDMVDSLFFAIQSLYRKQSRWWKIKLFFKKLRMKRLIKKFKTWTYEKSLTRFDKIMIKNIVTELSQSVGPGDKIIHTKDWGSFKLRKNGRVKLMIDNEFIRCTPIKIINPDKEQK